MKRFLATVALVILPSAAFADALESAADVIRTAMVETKPVAFSVTASHHGGGVTTVKAVGQREGAGPEKAWVSLKTQWKGSDGWMKTEADLRLLGGRAYFRINAVSGSPNAPDIAAFEAVRGTWFAVDASRPAVRAWFAPAIDPVVAGALVSMDRGRFASGYTYSFTPSSGPESVRTFLASALPWLLHPESSSPMKAKIDTNLSHQFQFASLTLGSSFEAKAQRQFHAVYVEVPGTVSALPSGAVASFYFGESVAAEATTAEPPLPEQSTFSSSEAPSYVLLRQPTGSDALSALRRNERLTQRSVIDLHGSDGKNVKVLARVATGPVQWNSLAAFNADFAQGKGILYRYGRPVNLRFSTQTDFGGLDVIFFDEAGLYISSATMPKCSAACPAYVPDRPASYALEVGVGFNDRMKVGPLWRLSLDWSASPVPGITLQSNDRSAVRAIERRMEVPAPRDWHTVRNADGDQTLRVLAELTATKIRIADVAAASAQRRDEQAARRLYSVLVDTMHQNHLKYSFIVVPGSTPDTFTLVLDGYSYASLDLLDVNRNGVLDQNEKPAQPGSSYVYHPFTLALDGPVFDVSANHEVAVYVPVKDDNGITVAILALVK